jgi:hypothetical protein
MLLERIGLLCAVALLGACNVAVSQKPMFAETQRSARLLLEDGLWAHFDKDCVVDTAKPRADWPKCADWIIVAANKAVGGSDMKADEPVQDIFFVDGTPPLIQANVRTNGKDAFFAFIVVKPTYSPAHRIVAVDVWPVRCGTQDAPDGKVKPWPGFNKDCQPDSVATLRKAARKSHAEPGGVISWTWVRAEKP